MKHVAASAVLLLALTGCLKAKQEIVVMPDGSGKVVLHLAMKLKGDATKVTQAELLASDPDEILDKVHGLVALARPTTVEKDGVVTVTMAGYFDDLNALKFMDDGDGAKAKPKQEFTLRREGETFVLEAKGNLLSDEEPSRGRNDPELAREREMFFKAMYTGFEFRQDVTLPGKVTSAEGYGSTSERTATYLISEKDLQKQADQRKINERSRFKIVCARSEVTDADAAAFRKELEKAKAEWPGLRAEMKKASEGKK